MFDGLPEAPPTWLITLVVGCSLTALALMAISVAFMRRWIRSGYLVVMTDGVQTDTAPLHRCSSCYFWKHLEEGYGHCNRFDVVDGKTVLGDRWGKINADQIIECGAIKPTIKVEALWFGTPADFGCRAWKPESWEMTSDWRFDRD